MADEIYQQFSDPLGNPVFSAGVAVLPLVTLIYFLAIHPWTDKHGVRHRGIEAYRAVFIAVQVAVWAAIFGLGMPGRVAGTAFLFGAAVGLFPIGWVVSAAMFLYQMTVVTGYFDLVKNSIVNVSQDRRIQVLLIGFAFGAFLEGAAGFGVPVAIGGALLVGLGFEPFHASVLALLATTAPVAFGAIGTPIVTLSSVTGLSELALSAMAATQSTFFSLLVPLLVVIALVKLERQPLRRVWEVWPAIVTAGGSFAVAQWVVATFLGPYLAAVAAGLFSLCALAVLTRVWKPPVDLGPELEPRHFVLDPAAPSLSAAAATMQAERLEGRGDRPPYRARSDDQRIHARPVVTAWVPWLLLTLFVSVWGIPRVQAVLNRPVAGRIPTVVNVSVPHLDRVVFRTAGDAGPHTGQRAVYTFNWLSAAGTAIFLAAVVAGLTVRASASQWREAFRRTAVRMRFPLLTIGVTLGFSYVVRYAGFDAIIGTVFTRTGTLYPFFAVLLGWLGTFLTGSNTASNAMFGSLQLMTARHLGMNEVLVVAANATGGVVGKMMDAQSIVVVSTVTYESDADRQAATGRILRQVFWPSLALVTLVGLTVLVQGHYVG